ncbi:hypothetical protein WICPIJ_004701 [Wickerhamomyces pijperi]|uniref:Uncharacterized protein n=1 Tax=Wickerhamomyces pijperi TaxID=599730 RepID=A0A9P8TN13_WICPI|nr:hypothetical protein WICPIJ_004701 [Wickerhamomyces pijperi]
MNSWMESGKVAENNKDWCLAGRKDKICSIKVLNSWDNILSASSMTKMEHSERSAIFLEAKSKIRPGVPTKTWTASSNLTISSDNGVPPVETIHWIFKCLPKVLTTWEVCKANSLVGKRSNAWILLDLVLIFCKVGIIKEAVLPVPFLALAKISLPARATGMESS